MASQVISQKTFLGTKKKIYFENILGKNNFTGSSEHYSITSRSIIEISTISILEQTPNFSQPKTFTTAVKIGLNTHVNLGNSTIPHL